MKTLRRDKRRFGRSWGIVVAVVAVVVASNAGGCIIVGGTDGSGGSGGEDSSSSSSSGEGGCIFNCSGSSSGSASSGSSSSGGFDCTGDADCIGFNDCLMFGLPCDCVAVGCVSGQCEPVEPLPDGMLAKNQLDGDCNTKVCDGQGFAMDMPDPTDAPPDSNDCTDDVCSMGFPAHPLSAEGTPCALGLCDGQGVCIQCVDTTQCINGTVCLSSICVPPTCDNGMQDVGESDVDCGSSCVRCALGKICLMNDDCQSGTCFESLCK